MSVVHPLYFGWYDFGEPLWSYTYVKYVLLNHWVAQVLMKSPKC